VQLEAITQRAVTAESTIVPGEQVLEMATIDGATAFGSEKDIGSLQLNKGAGFVLTHKCGQEVVEGTGLSSSRSPLCRR
jgi:cytosine/adenosine deaminase-related metal-dependent hydrolase